MLHDRVLSCGEPSYGTSPRPDPAGARLSGCKIGTRLVSGQGRSVGARISQRERILRAMVRFCSTSRIARRGHLSRCTALSSCRTLATAPRVNQFSRRGVDSSVGIHRSLEPSRKDDDAYRCACHVVGRVSSNCRPPAIIQPTESSADSGCLQQTEASCCREAWCQEGEVQRRTERAYGQAGHHRVLRRLRSS